MTSDAKDATDLASTDQVAASGRNAAVEIITFWAHLNASGMRLELVEHLTVKHHGFLFGGVCDDDEVEDE